VLRDLNKSLHRVEILGYGVLGKRAGLVAMSEVLRRVRRNLEDHIAARELASLEVGVCPRHPAEPGGLARVETAKSGYTETMRSRGCWEDPVGWEETFRRLGGEALPDGMAIVYRRTSAKLAAQAVASNQLYGAPGGGFTPGHDVIVFYAPADSEVEEVLKQHGDTRLRIKAYAKDLEEAPNSPITNSNPCAINLIAEPPTGEPFVPISIELG